MSWATADTTLVWRGKPVGLLALPASTDFFSMLGAQAQIGRTFSQPDLKNPCTLVLAYPFWQQKLGAPSDIAGQILTVDRIPCAVVGVMPKQFTFYPKEANAWSLITPASASAQKPWDSMTGVFGLLKPGVTRAQAEAELNAMEQRILPQAPASLSLLTSAVPVVLKLQDNFTWLAGRNLRSGLWVLSGAVSLILLMTCLNVANLLLGRATEDARGMAIRTALGSGRARLIRQMLTESLMLAFCGTGAGILLAMLMLHWFRAVNPVDLPPGNGVSLDWQVLLFAALLGVGSAIVFGLFPAWKVSRVDPNSALSNSQRGIGAGASAQRTSQILVVMQIALSFMLFVGAGLLAASLWRMASTRLGYRTNHVLTATIHLPQEHYPDSDAKSRFAADLSSAVSALPGVETVTAASNFTPIGENPLSIQADPSRFSAGGIATQSVGSNFFDAMQIPLFRGRVFDTQDRSHTQQVAIAAVAHDYRRCGCRQNNDCLSGDGLRRTTHGISSSHARRAGVSGCDGCNQRKPAGIGWWNRRAACRDRSWPHIGQFGNHARQAISCVVPTPLPGNSIRQLCRVGFAAGSGWPLWRAYANGRTADARNGDPHGRWRKPWTSGKQRIPEGPRVGSDWDCAGRYRIGDRCARSGRAAVWCERRERSNVCTRFHRLDPHHICGQLESSLAGGKHRSHAGASQRMNFWESPCVHFG